jgi:hypothetical protein
MIRWTCLAAPWAERLGRKPKLESEKGRIEDRRQDLYDGLLDKAVEHVWNAEHSIPFATGLWNGFATHRLWLVRPFHELLSHLGPVFAGPCFELVNCHAIRAGSTPVAFDLTPRFTKVLGETINSIKASSGDAFKAG